MIEDNEQIELGAGTGERYEGLKTVVGRDLQVRFMLDRGKIKKIKILNLIGLIVLLLVAGVVYFFFQDSDIFS